MIVSHSGSSASAPAVRRMPSPPFPGGLDDRHLDLNLLAIGYAQVFVQFDGLTVDLAVNSFRHGRFFLFVGVIRLFQFTRPLLWLSLVIEASAGDRPRIRSAVLH